MNNGLSILIGFIPYIAFGIASVFAGLGITDWQYWVLLSCVFFADINSYSRGFKKGTEIKK